MQSVTLTLNRTSLLELMQDFYILTGIRIVIFDSSYQEVLAWPQSHCSFCQLMHDHTVSREKCAESDRRSFERCRKKAGLEIYHCHAGLVEATAPLIDNGILVGYIMFGQISDLETEEETRKMLYGVLERYQLEAYTQTESPLCEYNVKLSEHNAKPGERNADHWLHADPLLRITHKTSEQIQAATKILEACTFYVLLKDMITLQRKNFITNLNTFLLEHLSEDLSVERLMQEFKISRNKLYDSANEYLGQGIAEYIKSLRLKEARRLLKETELAVHEISDRVGFNDYNYFCRVFKKEIGMTAKQYRKQE